MKIFLNGIELQDNLFFDGFNWGNFDIGDKVYGAGVNGHVFVFFDGMTSGAVWLVTPEGS